MQLTNSILQTTCFLNQPSKSSFRHHCASSNKFNIRAQSSRTTVTSQLASQEQDPAFDVRATVVNPAFRVKIDSTHTDGSDKARTSLRILFVSESGVCRGPLAVAAFAEAAEKQGLATSGGFIECSAAASRDYCVNEPPEFSAHLAAECLGWTLPQDSLSRTFLPSSDLAKMDLILVMDKFIAADVLREASVFDTIYLEAGFSGKVRNLGEFHPSAAVKPNSNTSDSTSSEGGGSASATTDPGKVFEINDPLYGNIGGEEEEDEVYRAALDIQQCCNGLVEFLVSLNTTTSRENNTNLRAAVEKWLQTADGVEWMRPPLLSPR
jgi:protein-tyrosine-phosphatase